MIKIELIINEESKEMAYQLLALAIKKKYKPIIRPLFQIYTDDGLEPVTNKILQNQLWRDEAGQDYDY